MTNSEITVYGAHWCPDCRRSKQFLGEHQIPYSWVDIEEDPTAEKFVIEKNDGKRIIPTIVFEDESFLVEPTNAELAQKLGLKTKASRSHYDLIVLGGGPAGLTAALYTAREAIDTLVIERAAFGGQAAGTEKLDNMPGFPDGVAGIEFSQRLRQQSERFGVELLQAQEIKGIHHQDNYHCVETTDGSQYSGSALLIATGSRYKRLNVAGESDYLGAGVHFCATCDGPFYLRWAILQGQARCSDRWRQQCHRGKPVTYEVCRARVDTGEKGQFQGHPGHSRKGVIPSEN
jgi:thioredoxin reductase (NADPH)